MAKQQPAKTLEPASPLKAPVDEHDLSQDFEFACKVLTRLLMLSGCLHLQTLACPSRVSRACSSPVFPVPSLFQPGWTFKPVRQVEAKLSIRFNYKAR